MATYVQTWTGAHTQSGSTSVITFSPSPSAGNHLRLTSYNGANRRISGITDDASNTWHSVASLGDTASANNITELWYVQNISGAITSVTVTYNATGGTNIELMADEFSGTATATSLDTSITSRTGVTVASPLTVGPTGTTTSNNENIYTIATSSGRAVIAPTGYTQRGTDSLGGIANAIMSADLNVTSTGAQSAVWTWTGGNANVRSILATFVDANQSPPGAPLCSSALWDTQQEGGTYGGLA